MSTPNPVDIALKETIASKGLSDEKIGDSESFKKVTKETELGAEVMAEFNSSSSLYDSLRSKAITNRDYYLGEDNEQGVSNLEGNIKVSVNLGATFIDLFTYLLTNNAPSVQFYGDPDPVSQAEASFKETMAGRLLADANWPKKFRDAAKTQFLIGYTHLYPFWNKDNPLGGKRGSFDLTALNPFTTRVKFKQDDFEKPESFITTVRLSASEILKKYDYEALPDSEDPFIPKTEITQDDGMTAVYTRYGDNDIRVVVNSREVDRIEHKLGFCPLVSINNIMVLNDMHGHSEIERWMALAQEINALMSAISEVVRDLAYPTLVEYNGALGGNRPNKLRGMLVPAKRSDRGEGLEYLVNNAQIAPMIQQVKLLISMLHFVSLMPEAAGGIFPANVTSGFQAKLSMQSATLMTDNRKIDWEYALKQIVKMAFKLLEKNDPSSLSIKAGSKTVKVSEIYDHEMTVVWPENLPVDIAREIQNLTLGIQTGLTSLHQAIERYNVLMGMGTSEDTIEYLKSEVDDPALSPDRALKVQQVRAQVTQILQQLSQMNAQLEQSRMAMGGGAESLPASVTPPAGTPTGTPPGGMTPPNINNLSLQAQPSDQKKAYPPTGREAVNLNSTNGKVISPQ